MAAVTRRPENWEHVRLHTDSLSGFRDSKLKIPRRFDSNRLLLPGVLRIIVQPVHRRYVHARKVYSVPTVSNNEAMHFSTTLHPMLGYDKRLSETALMDLGYNMENGGRES